MIKRLGLWVIALSSLAAAPAFAKGWIFSGGMGLTISPDLFLMNPGLEYVHDSRLTYGPMVQVGVGSGFSLFTFSGTVRYTLGDHPKFKPNLEGGMGLAVASGFGSSVGVHIMFGMGFDYKLDNRMSLGTMIRANLAPPMKTFFISWPLILFRMHV